ncbi:MAG: triphosphoribosyl-dephospho-CoA synthase CitG [Clostridium sp.]|uniref:triphosphoribosyl-dephospho-CoA synthase CitG n=1 Tax=Clostridium sp. TaxID=1506 RepID=UPI00305293F0
MNISEIDEFLDHREKRVIHQERLLKNSNGNTLATVRVNYPGLEKSNFITDNIVRIVYNDILSFQEKNIIYKEIYKNKEGLIGHFIFRTDYITIKKFLIYMEENHILGRCVDLDVYYIDKNQVDKNNSIVGSSRSELGLSPRRCFLCNEDARVCSRAVTHSIYEIKKYFNDKYEEYLLYIKNRELISYNISQIALESIISEVSTMPSFGLVSPSTMGSHKDMDYYTFIKSSFAIIPYIKDMVSVGYCYETPKNIFKAIRTIGIQCENKMFEATDGVNTHKGMIFLIGVISAAVGKAIYEKAQFQEIKNIVKDMCEDILEDFKDVYKKENLTHGERLYLKHNFTGIRGEVKGGLEKIFNDILPEYMKSELKGNNLYANTLLNLMSQIEDSTIVYRHNIDKLHEVQQESQRILDLGGFSSIEGSRAAIDFEIKCINDNISPGGSADLLAVTIFLGGISRNFDKV